MTDEPEADEAAAPDAVPAAAALAPELAPAPASAPSAVQSTVDAWVAQHIHNSPLSRSTEAWNHLYASLPHLVAKLEEL